MAGTANKPEPTVESLTAELTAVKAELATVQAKHADQALIVDDLKKGITEFIAKNATTEDELLKTKSYLSQTEVDLVDAHDVIAELKERIASQADAPGAAPTVKHQGETYQILDHGFTFLGRLVTLADLKADEELVATLVEIQASCLVKIEKPTKKK